MKFMWYNVKLRAIEYHFLKKCFTEGISFKFVDKSSINQESERQLHHQLWKYRLQQAKVAKQLCASSVQQGTNYSVKKVTPHLDLRVSMPSVTQKEVDRRNRDTFLDLVPPSLMHYFSLTARRITFFHNFSLLQSLIPFEAAVISSHSALGKKLVL